MWKVTVLVVIAAIGLAEACMYKGFECPNYTVVEKYSDYEVRSYPPLNWIMTSAVGPNRRLAYIKGYRRVYKYLNGYNDQGEMMDHTTPFRMRVLIQADNQTFFETALTVQSEFADNPPIPYGNKIKIVKEDTTMYAVRQFTGYTVLHDTWDIEAQKLANSVKNDKTVIKDKYYRVGYDNEYDPNSRRNEIWMVKKVKKETNEV